MADTSQTQLRYVREDAWGQIPTSPDWRNMRVTSFDLQPTKETQASNELRSDRQIPDRIQVGQGATGSADFELSFASFDDFLAAALGSAPFDSLTEEDTISNGVVATSFSLEEQIPHAGSDYFIR